MKSTYTPLNGNERIKIIFFTLFSISLLFAGVGIVPLTIILIGIYIMRKDQSYEPIKRSRKNLELYYKVIIFASCASLLIPIYYEIRYYSPSPSERTDNYDIKKTLNYYHNSFINYFDLIKTKDKSSSSVTYSPKFTYDGYETTEIFNESLSIVEKVEQSGTTSDYEDIYKTTYKVYLDMPEHPRQTFSSYGGWDEATLAIFKKLISSPDAFNQAISDYKDANYSRTRDIVLYMFIASILLISIYWRLRVFPLRFIMWIYDSLYFNQINPHAEWVAKNGIFFDQYKKRLHKIINKIIRKECSLADEIEKLKGLLDDGIIDNDEFIAAKKKILGSDRETDIASSQKNATIVHIDPETDYQCEFDTASMAKDLSDDPYVITSNIVILKCCTTYKDTYEQRALLLSSNNNKYNLISIYRCPDKECKWGLEEYKFFLEPPFVGMEPFGRVPTYDEFKEFESVATMDNLYHRIESGLINTNDQLRIIKYEVFKDNLNRLTYSQFDLDLD